jgi:hypothetical protein
MPKMTAQELRLDYFLIYDVNNREVKEPVSLKGQFEGRRRPLASRVVLLDYFANPVEKNREPIYDKHAHLTWYRTVQAAEPRRVVSLGDQFGKWKLSLGDPEALLVPTHKREQGSAPPERLDHYKVYRVLDWGRTPQAAVSLRDQFGALRAKLRVPRYFAVPVEKVHNRRRYALNNPRTHLVIYAITPKQVVRKVAIVNQISRSEHATMGSVMLAAPCIKLGWQEVR